MPEVGLGGQKKLKGSSILVVGAGGLGNPVAIYLAAAGVGRIGIVDFDIIEESNLQRQVLYRHKDIGRPKAEVTKERLLELNPDIRVDVHNLHLNTSNASRIIGDYDIVVDGTDNFPTRYLLNDACVFMKKPYIYGSIYRFDGQVAVFDARRGPCYRCLFPRPPPAESVPSCAEGGVLGVLPGIIGCIQAEEAIKLVLGKGEPLIGKLLLFEALTLNFVQLTIARNPLCELCGESQTITELIDYESFCGVVAAPDSERVITPNDLMNYFQSGKRFVLLDVREQFEHEAYSIKGSKLIPLSELSYRAGELDSADEIVVYCHSGIRSAKAIEILSSMGFRKLKNLKGGVLGWAATQSDPITWGHST